MDLCETLVLEYSTDIINIFMTGDSFSLQCQPYQLGYIWITVIKEPLRDNYFTIMLGTFEDCEEKSNFCSFPAVL